MNPDAPKGGTLYLGNPDRRTSFDKFNPYTLKGSSPTGAHDPDVRAARRPLGRRAGDHVRPRSRKRCWSRRTSRRSRSASIRRRASTTATRSLAADVKHSFDMLMSKDAAPRSAPRSRASTRSTVRRRAHGPLRPQGPHATTRSSMSAACRCSRASGARAGRQAQAVRRDHHRVSDHVRPLHDRRRPTPGAASSSSVNKNYWARDLGVAKGHVQLRQGRLSPLPRPRRQRWRPSRPASSTSAGIRRVARYVRTTTAPSGATAASSRRSSTTASGQGLQAYLLNLRRPIFQDRRVRQALDHTYDFEKINVYRLRCAPTACSPTRISPPTACRAPGELALLEPFRNELPPEVFGPAYVPPRTRHEPQRAARQPEEGAHAARARRAGRSAPTACCATPRASRSSSSTSTRRRSGQFRVDLRAQPRACSASSTRCGMVDFAIYRKRLETFDFDLVDDQHRPTSPCRRRRAQGPSTRQQHGRRSKAPATTAASRTRRSMPHRGDGAGQDHGASCATRRARSTAS